MDIIMIRHGESMDNVAQVLSSPTTCLTDKGVEQIKKTREILEDYTFKKVYFSPYKRTDETRFHLGLEGIEEKRIEEIKFGLFEGMAYKDFTTKFPEESKLWMDDPFTYKLPDGESIYMLYERVKNFLDEVIKEDEDILLITHEGVIKVICSWVFDDPNYFFKFKADNGSISIISIDKGYKYIKKLNY